MMKPQVLYVVKAVDWSARQSEIACKIGITQNFRSRLAMLRTGCPFRIAETEVFHEMPNGAGWVEQLVLSALKDYRLRGEWLSCPSEAVLCGLEWIQYTADGIFPDRQPEGVSDADWYRGQFMAGFLATIEDLAREAA